MAVKRCKYCSRVIRDHNKLLVCSFCIRDDYKSRKEAERWVKKIKK